MITVRPATADELAEFHPEAAGTSYRAWACELDGETVGAIGLALTRPRACLFCGFSEALRPHLKSMTVLRLLKQVGDLIKQRNAPVYAIRDRTEPKAAAILSRLGFEPYAEVDGDDVWHWSPR